MLMPVIRYRERWKINMWQLIDLIIDCGDLELYI